MLSSVRNRRSILHHQMSLTTMTPTSSPGQLLLNPKTKTRPLAPRPRKLLGRDGRGLERLQRQRTYRRVNHAEDSQKQQHPNRPYPLRRRGRRPTQKLKKDPLTQGMCRAGATLARQPPWQIKRCQSCLWTHLGPVLLVFRLHHRNQVSSILMSIVFPG